MAGVILGGPRKRVLQVDEEGHRTYGVEWLIQTSINDGPTTVYLTPGLPTVGSIWNFGNDIDVWAWCRPNATIEPYQEEEKARIWKVTQSFSTRPLNKCSEGIIENPLLEPPNISGTFVKFSEEKAYDRFGIPITNSSWEQFRGAQVEFDESRPTVKIQQNIPVLNLPLLSLMANTVNASPLWGLPSRTIKLSDIQWERKFYGFCSVYYSRTLEFEINFQTWDRLLLDEGTKVLNGRWAADGSWELIDIDGQPPDRFNPAHFVRFFDRNGQPGRVVLDGFGKPYNPFDADQTRYWCIDDEEAPFCFFGFLLEAFVIAEANDAIVYGPYDTQEECEENCSLGNMGTGTPGLPSTPGQRFVSYYRQANFLLLGIPTVF